MTYHRQMETGCRICSFVGSGKSLTNHVLKEHGLKAEEYTVRHVICCDKRPACTFDRCQVPVRYVGLSFKKYCKDHSFLAEAEAGRVGGRVKQTWNKGRTAESDPRILVLTGSMNHFFGRTHSSETREKISQSKMLPMEQVLSRVSGSASGGYFEVISCPEDYTGWQQMMDVRCTSCDVVTQRCLMDLERGTRCHTCYPVGSLPETEIADFVRGLGLEVVQNTKRVIAPKELDVWVPSKSTGIEYHGLFWHSGGIIGETDRRRHKEKQLLARDRGIRLMQFFADEWRDRRPIVESMIENRRGLSRKRVGARELSFRELDSRTGSAFLQANHLDGDVRSSLYLGLCDGDRVVSAMSFRTPVQGKYGRVWEVARFANLTGHTVPGAASRLIKGGTDRARAAGLTGLLSYSDLRFGDGEVYRRCGMELVGETGLNYWYTDGRDRFDRFRYRAQDGMTEREYSESKGVRRVYGCGHRVWLLRF